jgi:hypothetical protein
LLQRTPTQAQPALRALAIAVSAAYFMTRCPMPLSPFTSAIAARSRSMRMFGRGFTPPA